MTSTELLTIKQVAERLGVAVSTLRNWRNAGGHSLVNGKAIRVGGGLRWRSGDVDEYILSLAYDAS